MPNGASCFQRRLGARKSNGGRPQRRDPAGNFQLRPAIEKAKAAGVKPNANIDRAIAKGLGQAGGRPIARGGCATGLWPWRRGDLVEALPTTATEPPPDPAPGFRQAIGGNLGENRLRRLSLRATGCGADRQSDLGRRGAAGELAWGSSSARMSSI